MNVEEFESEHRTRQIEKCAHPEGESRVYCIVNFMRDAVKIGVTMNFRRRLQQLQTASPDELYLHEHIRGDKAKERELHQRYARHRRIGEWFHDPGFKIVGEFAVFSVNDEIEDLRRRQRGEA